VFFAVLLSAAVQGATMQTLASKLGTQLRRAGLFVGDNRSVSTIDDYLRGLPAARKAALERVRAIVSEC